MRHGQRWMIAFAVAAAPMAAQAAPRDTLQPVQLGNESIRFDRGDYVVDMSGQHAAVQIRSMPSDHGYQSFVVTVLNAGPAPINLDVGHIQVTGTRESVRVLTRAEMEQKAERRAGWAKFFTTLGGALVASVQAGSRYNYNVTTSTRYGFYSTNISAPCYRCQVAAGYTLALTDARLAQIRGALDETRAALGEQMLQLTTVDPGRAYGGRIFLTKFSPASMSEMHLIVTVGKEAFEFGFRFAPPGTPTPAYRMVPVPQLAPFTVQPAIYAPTPHPVPAPPPAFAQPAARPVPIVLARVAATPANPAPPVVRALTSTGANSVRNAKWRRYYDILISSGTSKSEARLMADGEFGPVD